MPTKIMLVPAVIVFSLLVIKIVWNFILPYGLTWNYLKSSGERNGTSLMPYWELATFVLWLLLAVISRSNIWILNIRGVIIIGISLIVGSYLHMVIMGYVLHRLLLFYEQRQKK